MEEAQELADRIGIRSHFLPVGVEGTEGSPVAWQAELKLTGYYGSSGGWSGNPSTARSPSHDVAGVAQYVAIASRRGA